MGLRGSTGVDLKETWKGGVSTYLGIFASGCPNMFMIFGPQGEIIYPHASHVLNAFV